MVWYGMDHFKSSLSSCISEAWPHVSSVPNSEDPCLFDKLPLQKSKYSAMWSWQFTSTGKFLALYFVLSGLTERRTSLMIWWSTLIANLRRKKFHRPQIIWPCPNAIGPRPWSMMVLLANEYLWWGIWFWLVRVMTGKSISIHQVTLHRFWHKSRIVLATILSPTHIYEELEKTTELVNWPPSSLASDCDPMMCVCVSQQLQQLSLTEARFSSSN